MPEQLLFEYAIIRVVPRVEREEFVNIGVILFCKRQNLLQTRITIDDNRLLALFPGLDINMVKSYATALERIAAGEIQSNSPIAALDTPSRFRWLTATRSTIIQTSKVHPGLCTNFEHQLDHLHREMVLLPE